MWKTDLLQQHEDIVMHICQKMKQIHWKAGSIFLLALDSIAWNEAVMNVLQIAGNSVIFCKALYNAHCRLAEIILQMSVYERYITHKKFYPDISEKCFPPVKKRFVKCLSSYIEFIMVN